MEKSYKKEAQKENLMNVGFGVNQLERDWFFLEDLKGVSKKNLADRQAKDFYRVSMGILYLKSDKNDLSSSLCRNVILKIPISDFFNVETKIEWDELSCNQNFGLICYYNVDSYIKYGVFKEKNGCHLRVLEWEKDTYKLIVDINLLQVREIELRISGLHGSREFWYRIGEDEWSYLSHIENMVDIYNEELFFGKRFFTSMIGLYACCKETEQAEVKFLYFK